MGKLERYKFG